LSENRCTGNNDFIIFSILIMELAFDFGTRRAITEMNTGWHTAQL